MIEALKDVVLKALGALIPTLLGWIYKAEWIDKRLRVRVSSEGDGITVQGGELPYLRVWFEVTNLSPFTVEIERVIVQVQLRGGVIGEFVHLHKHELKPSTDERFLLESAMTAQQLAYLSRLQGGPEATLYLTAYVNCRVHNLRLQRNVQSGNVRYVNCAA